MSVFIRPLQTLTELSLINGGKHRLKRVVRRNAVDEAQLLGKLTLFGSTVFFELHPVIGATDHSAQRDEENILKLVAFSAD